MKQVFLGEGNFAIEDALPVSERLLIELKSKFAASNETWELSAAEMLSFLRDFYARYELSQPQRRIWGRFEKNLAEKDAAARVKLSAAEVSARRERKFSKKT